MKLRELLTSKYMTQDTVGDKPVRYTVKRFTEETFTDEAGNESSKLVVYFEDTAPGMVLNQTNLRTLINAFGDDDSDMIGKEIELYADRNVMMGGRRVGGLRIRIPMSDVPW